jgi:hypothetical protein
LDERRFPLQYKGVGLYCGLEHADAPYAIRLLRGRANVRFGSFATGANQHQVRPCPLCPDSNQIPHLAEMTLWANS